MKKGKKNAFSLLAKPLREAIKEREFLRATEPQAKAIPVIIKNKNVLLIAPTASGKTEAAILPILSKFISSKGSSKGISILYITPLRALNRDLLERIEWWCKRLDVKVGVRHGDTEIRERSMQAKSPPDMLITTPETLQAILPGKRMKKHLEAVKYVIIDEVHEFAEDKRGSQLSLALERLRWITTRDFQIVGLSATIGTPEKVAKFLVGNERDVEVIKVPIARKMLLKVLYPKPSRMDYELSSKLYAHPEVVARLRIMRDLIKKHQSVLLFTNTRARAEVLASRFKVWDLDFPISIHHGSLAKPSRIAAERGLKDGNLKGLVCTSSLELGLDIGRVDFVIQYMSPRQVTRLIQRVGRSGHRVGRIAEGVIIAMDSDDALEAIVIAKKAYEENLEPVIIPKKPFDVLAHQVAGLLLHKKRWYIYEILEVFKKAYPYAELTEKDLISVLSYMHSRYPRLAWFSEEDGIVLKPQRTKELYRYFFEKLSMIPDEKQYLVIDRTSETPVGILDEAFVAEYGEPGTKFIVRGTPWKMMGIHGDKIYVKPIDDPTGAIPSWVGEEIPVPFEVAYEVGKMRRILYEEFKKGLGKDEIIEKISRMYSADKETLAKALEETFDQVSQNYPIPSDKAITIEDWEDYVIINANLGTLVNRTLARLIGYILSEEIEYTIGVQQDPYRIVIQTADLANSDDIIKILISLTRVDITELIKKALMRTGLFKRRLVHVARRFGAISRWVDFSSISLKRLMESFEGTAIIEEALKETLEKDLDVFNTAKVLNKIANGEIEIINIDNKGRPTPITKIGLERISMKTDLIPPEKMKRILIESTKARILNEVRSFVCTSCWNYAEMMRIKDLPEDFKCPFCNSKAVGILNETKEEIEKLIRKKDKTLSNRERNLIDEAKESAKLFEKYGKVVAYIMAGRKLAIEDVKDILRYRKEISDNLFEAIIEAEKEALKRRF
ncbi:MAG: DEAD/DEAH box helicase [Candidatus Bathyarchaeia archaeon]